MVRYMTPAQILLLVIRKHLKKMWSLFSTQKQCDQKEIVANYGNNNFCNMNYIKHVKTLFDNISVYSGGWNGTKKRTVDYNFIFKFGYCVWPSVSQA